MDSPAQEEGLAFEGAGQTLRRKRNRGGECRPAGWEFDGGEGRWLPSGTADGSSLFSVECVARSSADSEGGAGS